jgi:hypothetical protein
VPSPSLRAALAACALLLLLACPTSPEPDPPEPEGCAADERLAQADDGESVCIPLDCGEGPWGDLDRTGALHVAPWGSSDGDGSEEAPFASIQDAVDASEVGGRVVIASDGPHEAVYDEALDFGAGDDVELAGRCPELVRIDASDGDAPTWAQSGGDTRASSLTISGGNGGLWFDGGAGAGAFVDVALVDNRTVGLAAFGTGVEVSFEDGWIRGTTPNEAGAFGRGVDVELGGYARVERTELSGNHNIGAFASLDGILELTDCTVSDQRVADITPATVGVSAQESGHVLATRVVVSDNRGLGVSAVMEGVVELVDSEVLETRARSGDQPRGINVQLGGQVIGRGLRVEGNDSLGLYAYGEGSLIDLEDSVVRSSRRLDELPGVGAQILGGATLTGRGVLFEGHEEVALVIALAGSRVTLEDSEVRGTRPGASGLVGQGVHVRDGALLEGAGLEIIDNMGIGLVVSGADARAELHDSRVAGTKTSVAMGSGQGVSVQLDGRVSASGLVVEDNEGPGLYLLAGGAALLTEPDLRANHFAGAALLAGGVLSITGGQVRDNVPSSGSGGGVGVYAWDLLGADHLELDGVSFSDHLGPDVYLVGEGVHTIVDCSFEGSSLGVLATGGIGRWQADGSAGLLLQDNRFEGLDGDAILLDGSSASLVGNHFADLGGEPLYRQRCDETEEPEVEEGSAADPSCQQWARGIEPLLSYAPAIVEPDLSR